MCNIFKARYPSFKDMRECLRWRTASGTYSLSKYTTLFFVFASNQNVQIRIQTRMTSDDKNTQKAQKAGVTQCSNWHCRMRNEDYILWWPSSLKSKLRPCVTLGTVFKSGFNPDSISGLNRPVSKRLLEHGIRGTFYLLVLTFHHIAKSPDLT